MHTLFYNFQIESRSGESSPGGASQQLLGAQVSRGFFSGLGLPPLLGRGFRPGDAATDHDRVAVLSYGFWRREFAADPQVIGKTIVLSREQYTVIGVAGAHFDESLAMRGIEIWTPLALSETAMLRSNDMAIFGRLKPSISLAQANREMQLAAQHLADEYPELYRGWSASATRTRETPRGTAPIAGGASPG